MFLFRGLWFLFLNLMLVASCWSSVESPEQTGHRHARNSLDRAYFDYVFSEENKRLLTAIMISVRQVYDHYNQDQWSEGLSAPGNQTEVRQQLLTHLIQQAVRHTTSKVTVVDNSHPDSCMFHLLQAFSNAPAMEESGHVVDWYQARWYRALPVLLQGAVAEDRMDSMESLIQEAVQNSFREFPSNPISREQLARQLGFIVVEMQELFLRGEALRSLSYKVRNYKQIPEIASDPGFPFFLSFLTERFNSHNTLWHIESEGCKGRQYQEDLAALFMEAAHRENEGIDWYQRVRNILDGEKTKIPFRTIKQKDEDREQEYQFWIRIFLGPVFIGATVMFVFLFKEIYGSEPEPSLGRAHRG
ncbi:hypothetical protein [Endozoicomonas sp. 4G]|uniref:hypothetical protein n=1 Tax=Endozoicomonas sp. 4G TaxID=2872754 RepID=UPI0020789C0C|nr:hypothetical protein [Endozoicomonas sp. 4G]